MAGSSSTPAIHRLVVAVVLLAAYVGLTSGKRPVHSSFKAYLPSDVLKDREKHSSSSGGDKFPSYLPTALLKDRGKSESHLPEPLLQTAMTYYQTLPTNVDPAELMTKLGARFDSKWMSVERPYEDLQRVEVSPSTDFDPELLSDLRELNFSYVDDDDDGVLTLKPHLQKLVEKWLLQKSSCPVQYRWEDVGPFFWPRWVKKGSCSDKRPCSWPPGMHCVPSPRPMTVRILRWHCRPRPIPRRQQTDNKRNQPPRNRKRKPKPRDKLRRPFRLKCRWRKVRYPITTRCYCTC